jgi:hypothetical protein
MVVVVVVESGTDVTVVTAVVMVETVVHYNYCSFLAVVMMKRRSMDAVIIVALGLNTLAAVVVAVAVLGSVSNMTVAQQHLRALCMLSGMQLGVVVAVVVAAEEEEEEEGLWGKHSAEQASSDAYLA